MFICEQQVLLNKTQREIIIMPEKDKKMTHSDLSPPAIITNAHLERAVEALKYVDFTDNQINQIIAYSWPLSDLTNVNSKGA